MRDGFYLLKYCMSVIKVQACEEVVAAVLLRDCCPCCGDCFPSRVKLLARGTASFGVEGRQLNRDRPVAVRGGYKVVCGSVEGDKTAACGCEVHKLAVRGRSESEWQGEEGEEGLHSVDV